MQQTGRGEGLAGNADDFHAQMRPHDHVMWPTIIHPLLLWSHCERDSIHSAVALVPLACTIRKGNLLQKVIEGTQRTPFTMTPVFENGLVGADTNKVVSAARKLFKDDFSLEWCNVAEDPVVRQRLCIG